MLHVTSFVAESLYIAGECNGTRILRAQVPDLNVEQGHCTLDSFKERTSKVRKIKCPFFNSFCMLMEIVDMGPEFQFVTFGVIHLVNECSKL